MSLSEPSRRTIVRVITAGFAAAYTGKPQTSEPERLLVGQSELEIHIEGPSTDLAKADLLSWVNHAASAVAGYFGRFPVANARLTILSRPDRRGILSGRTWGEHGAHTRISIGQHSSADDLRRDWTLTHEFVHYGFPDMPERHHWIEEGIATYVEPIARANAGMLDTATAWFEMVRDMPKGQPQPGDQGLDNTHTWGRTYWGGAGFCLLADVTIRKRTNNRKGLRDALRGILAAGGTIEASWPIERALAIGDRAAAGDTLMSLYNQMSGEPVPVDLAGLWKELGVARLGDHVLFDDTAPLAAIRRAIL